MTVLITGGAGYIGSHIAYGLEDAGEKVVVLDDLSTGSRGLIPPTAILITGNCGNEALLDQAIREHDVSAVIHAAASTVVSESVAHPERYHRNNFVNTQIVAETAIRRGIKHFIFSSTAAVYGDATVVPITEEDGTEPVSPYGESKLLAERMLQKADDAGRLRFVALRYFNVAGADPGLRTGESSADPTHLIRRAVQAAMGVGPTLEIYGTDYPTHDGTCIRDYIHVSDVMNANLNALRHLRDGGKSLILNCGNEHGFSVNDVVASVKRISGNDFPTVPKPRRPGDPAVVVASSALARTLLGWKPRFSNLDAIVRDALAWETKLKTLDLKR